MFPVGYFPSGYFPSGYWPPGYWPPALATVAPPWGPPGPYFPRAYWPPGYWPPGYWPPWVDGPATLRDAVRWLLRGTASIGVVVGQRIRYARSRQKDSEPRVTYLVPSRTYGRDLDGPDGTSEARVRVSAWATDSEQAADLAERIRLALDGWSGWVGSVYVASIDHEASIDLPEWDGDGGEATVYQIAIDFMVDHRVEVPGRG